MIKDAFRWFRQTVFMWLARRFGRPFELPEGPISVIAPHPDDEVFGTGGLIALAVTKGLPVQVIVLTDGDCSHHGCCNLEESEIGRRRRELCTSTAKALGYPSESIHYLGWHDNALPSAGDNGFEDLVKEMVFLLKDIKPFAVLVPHPFEGWKDHVAAECLVHAAIDKLDHPVRLIYYCVWFWFNLSFRRAKQCSWRNARILDINNVYGHKMAAVNLYLDSKAPCGVPWIGRLPLQLLRIFRKRKELFFDADR